MHQLWFWGGRTDGPESCFNKRFKLLCQELHVFCYVPCWTGTYGILTGYQWNSLPHGWKAEIQHECIEAQGMVVGWVETHRDNLIPSVHTEWLHERRRKIILLLSWFSSPPYCSLYFLSVSHGPEMLLSPSSSQGMYDKPLRQCKYFPAFHLDANEDYLTVFSHGVISPWALCAVLGPTNLEVGGDIWMYPEEGNKASGRPSTNCTVTLTPLNMHINATSNPCFRCSGTTQKHVSVLLCLKELATLLSAKVIKKLLHFWKSSRGNKYFFFSPANFSVFSYDMSHSYQTIYPNSMWIASRLPFFKDCLKEKSIVRKAQKMGSDVESDVMTDLQIENF